VVLDEVVLRDVLDMNQPVAEGATINEQTKPATTSDHNRIRDNLVTSWRRLLIQTVRDGAF
jgi:hypothetical protein